ncbi:MAG: hypothetical protein ACK53F_08675 [Betaproteobacteria bacterium]
MVIDMNDARLDTIAQIREFLAGTADVGFSLPTDKTVRYGFVSTVLKRHRYFERTKGQRGVLFAYLLRLSSYTRQHLTKLIARFRQERSLAPRSRASRTNFGYRYGADDVMLLAEVDRLHDTLSGPATKVILMRAWQVFGDDRFINLSGISVSHLYNLRASDGCVEATHILEQDASITGRLIQDGDSRPVYNVTTIVTTSWSRHGKRRSLPVGAVQWKSYSCRKFEGYPNRCRFFQGSS